MSRETAEEYLQHVSRHLALSEKQTEDFKSEIESLQRRGFTILQAATYLRKQIRPWP